MAKSNLYTGGGDTGTTSLVGGERVKKNSVRINAYGTLDELSAFLGALAADKGCTAEVREQLLSIQNMLFNLGSYLATHAPEGEQPKVAGLAEKHISALEDWIDALDEHTPRIRAFVLPGGSEVAAKSHIARTVCRRAERRVLDLAEEAYVDPLLLRYLNRLSDYLFILARYLNFMAGEQEIVWKREI